MKIKIVLFGALLICAGILLSCVTTSQFSPGIGNKYHYTFKMVSPVKSSKLLFQDDSIIIQFKFDDAAIQFQLQNVSELPVMIDWDKASIGIRERYYGLRHASNFYIDTLRVNSIMMPPLGYLRDVIIPRDNIYYDGEKWVETDLLPTTDHRSLQTRQLILKNVGQRISLMLPVTFGSTAKNYKFDFQVDSVKQLPWNDYRPVKRNPPQPKPAHSVTALDNVTTAVIVVGVLGFSAYVLSIKKNPPSE